jgi:hypothetical protein
MRIAPSKQTGPRPRLAYGKGPEANRAREVLELPEIQPFLGSESSTQYAKIYLQNLFGPGRVSIPFFHGVIQAMKVCFPHIATCGFRRRGRR